MFHRFAVMVAAAAFSASSVAPAQVPTVSRLVALPAIQADDVLTPPPAATPTTPNSTSDSPAATQVDAPARLPTRLADAVGRAAATTRELECLAVGVYFESKSEPLAGQMAVGHVIANRANSHGRFPSSYCGVLFQRGQFSFVRGGGWPPVAKSGAQWRSAMNVARLVDGALRPSNIGKALFFHAKRVSPGWKLTKVASIGNHVFYR
jgi:N-acetylmuramoyl-L-alanine amidase